MDKRRNGLQLLCVRIGGPSILSPNVDEVIDGAADISRQNVDQHTQNLQFSLEQLVTDCTGYQLVESAFVTRQADNVV